jgi:hypothetical protein
MIPSPSPTPTWPRRPGDYSVLVNAEQMHLRISDVQAVADRLGHAPGVSRSRMFIANMIVIAKASATAVIDVTSARPSTARPT